MALFEKLQEVYPKCRIQEDKNYEQKYKRHKDGSVANIESKEYYANNRKIRSRIPSASDDKLSEF